MQLIRNAVDKFSYQNSGYLEFKTDPSTAGWEHLLPSRIITTTTSGQIKLRFST